MHLLRVRKVASIVARLVVHGCGHRAQPRHGILELPHARLPHLVVSQDVPAPTSQIAALRILEWRPTRSGERRAFRVCAQRHRGLAGRGRQRQSTRCQTCGSSARRACAPPRRPGERRAPRFSTSGEPDWNRAVAQGRAAVHLLHLRETQQQHGGSAPGRGSSAAARGRSRPSRGSWPHTARARRWGAPSRTTPPAPPRAAGVSRRARVGPRCPALSAGTARSSG
jgi:hypothetical protein